MDGMNYGLGSQALYIFIFKCLSIQTGEFYNQESHIAFYAQQNRENETYLECIYEAPYELDSGQPATSLMTFLQAYKLAA